MRIGLQTQILKPREEGYQLVRQVDARQHFHVDNDTFVSNANGTEVFTREGDFKFSLSGVDTKDKILAPEHSDVFAVDEHLSSRLSSYSRKTGEKLSETSVYYSALGHDGTIKAHTVTPNREQDLAVTFTPELGKMSQFEFGYHVQKPHYMTDSDIWVATGKTKDYEKRSTVHDGTGKVLFESGTELKFENSYEREGRALVLLSSPGKKRILLDIQDGELKGEFKLPKDTDAVVPVEGGYLALGYGRVDHVDSTGKLVETGQLPTGSRNVHFDGTTLYSGGNGLNSFTPGEGLKVVHKGKVENLALLKDGGFLIQHQGQFSRLNPDGVQVSQSDNPYRIEPENFLDTKVSLYAPVTNDRDGWQDFADGVISSYHFLNIAPGEHAGTRAYPTSAYKINFVKNVGLEEGLEALGLSTEEVTRFQEADPERHMSNSPVLVPHEEEARFKEHGPAGHRMVLVDRENNRINYKGRESRSIFGDFGAVIDFNTLAEPHQGYPDEASGLAKGAGEWLETSGKYPVFLGEESRIIEQVGNKIVALGSKGSVVVQDLEV